MKFHHLSATNNFLSLKFNSSTPLRNLILLPRQSNPLLGHCLRCSSQLSRFIPVCSLSNPTKQASFSTTVSPSDSSADWDENLSSVPGIEDKLNVLVGNPVVPLFLQPPTKLSLSDRAFVLLTFIACTTSVAFVSLVVAAIPTLYAMRRAATSLAKLADTAREELPGTMAAMRLSGMEISDLTLELSDLSQEIADGVNKSTEAIKAAEAGIRQIGALARHHTVSMIEERASLPIISLQPVVVGAAKKTSHAVGQATKTLMNMISGRGSSSENEDDRAIDRVEL